MAKQGTVWASRNRLAVLLLWSQIAETKTTTQSKQTSSTRNITDVTSIVTVQGSAITEIYTPTFISISGLLEPIKTPTTITTTNSAKETVAIAIAAGAGVVAGGGLAAWLFKPVPGAPPAPTSPPPFSTHTPSEPSSATDQTTLTSKTSSSSEQAYSCPYPTTGYPISFVTAAPQAQWTLALPPPSTSTAFSPKCTSQGSNNQLLRGSDPGYIDALAATFCKGDLSKSRNASLDQSNLPADSSFNNSQYEGIRVNFDFDHKITNPGCAQNCIAAYNESVLACEYNSHVLYGGASLEQGCGSYSFEIDADPVTNLTCNPIPDPVYFQYEYRDAAVDAIENFCTAQDGKVFKQGNESTYINELYFSATYASDCQGSGTYTVSHDTCVKYLMRTLDSCDTNTVMYKHGGTVTDLDNCGSFTFHPTGHDVFACWPQNQNAGYVYGHHVNVTSAMAKDAINQFCHRSGSDQTFSLDPHNIPSPNSFVDNSCTAPGYASCNYFYYTNGTRASAESLGDISITLNAAYMNPDNDFKCGTNLPYVIQGDRCQSELEKVIGIQPKGNCLVGDQSSLTLGSFLENADKGCVWWNFFAVSTHG